MKSFREYLNESLRDFVDSTTKDGIQVQIGSSRSERLKAFSNLLARYAKSGKVPSELQLARGKDHIDFSDEQEQETVYIYKDKDIKVTSKYFNGRYIVKVQRVG